MADEHDELSKLRESVADVNSRYDRQFSARELESVFEALDASNAEVRRLRELEWRIESDRLGVKQELAVANAEVGRLRDELQTMTEEARNAHALANRQRAQLAAVCALPVKWRALGCAQSGSDCADDIDALFVDK